MRSRVVVVAALLLLASGPARAQSRLLFPEDLEASGKLKKIEELGKRGQWDKVVLGLDRLLADALEHVAKSERQVLVLHLRHGLRPAEIAHALEREPSTVRTQLARGLERLRRALPASVAGALVTLATSPEAAAESAALVAAGARGVGREAALARLPRACSRPPGPSPCLSPLPPPPSPLPRPPSRPSPSEPSP